jgi:hypothetical protein
MPKQINYKAFSRVCYPGNVYLRQDKLWFIRRSNREFRAARPPCVLSLPDPDPVEEYFHISYFDLNKDSHIEHIVGKITEVSHYNVLKRQWL